MPEIVLSQEAYQLVRLRDLIEKAILLFKDQGKAGERFADTINRLGFENVEKQLMSDELLGRKQEIVEA